MTVVSRVRGVLVFWEIWAIWFCGIRLRWSVQYVSFDRKIFGNFTCDVMSSKTYLGKRCRLGIYHFFMYVVRFTCMSVELADGIGESCCTLRPLVTAHDVHGNQTLINIISTFEFRYTIFTEGHIKQNLRYTQKTIYFAYFTDNVSSYLLRSPALLRGTIGNRTYGIRGNLFM